MNDLVDEARNHPCVVSLRQRTEASHWDHLRFVKHIERAWRTQLAAQSGENLEELLRSSFRDSADGTSGSYGQPVQVLIKSGKSGKTCLAGAECRHKNMRGSKCLVTDDCELQERYSPSQSSRPGNFYRGNQQQVSSVADRGPTASIKAVQIFPCGSYVASGAWFGTSSRIFTAARYTTRSSGESVPCASPECALPPKRFQFPESGMGPARESCGFVKTVSDAVRLPNQC